MRLWRALLISWFGMCVWAGHAQQRPAPPADLQTSHTNFGTSTFQKKARRKHSEKVDFIYSTRTKGILYGNPCATAATRSMNFVYVLDKPGAPGSLTDKQRFFHNTGVKLKLCITRTPFWKLILNKRLKPCAPQTGDIVG